MIVLLRVIAAVGLLSVGWQNVHAAAYIVTDLGTLGGTESIGWDINASGQVTGGASTTADAAEHAFVWTPTKPNGTVGTMVDLGTLEGDHSVGRGINDSGQVTGESDRRAFFYDGAMHDLSTFGGPRSAGRGINNSGQVTGFASTADLKNHAFFYSGAMYDLGTLGGPESQSSGAAINDSGQITGDATVGPALRAFVYDGVMYDLGTLGGTHSVGYAINASGHVTGRSHLTGDTTIHAFLYDGTMRDLGTLGGAQSYGLGINSSGQVTGYSTLVGFTQQRAFLYSDATGMVDLNSLIDSNSEWTLLVGNAINDAGQITGQGLIHGEFRAFLLTPVPEPSTRVLAVLGLAGIFGLRRYAVTQCIGSRRSS